jgi:hypothetical protein
MICIYLLAYIVDCIYMTFHELMECFSEGAFSWPENVLRIWTEFNFTPQAQL